MYKRLFDIDPWKIATHTLDRENKRLMESLTSIGNGYMGMRGNFEETYSGDTLSGTYLAGIWFPDKTRVGWWKNGYPDYFGKVINATNFIGVDIFIDGEVLDLAKIEVADFYTELDMKQGLLTRSFTYETENTSIHFRFQRFVSIVTKELALVKIDMDVTKGEPTVLLVSKIDGNVKNEDSNYEELFWNELDRGMTNGISHLTVETIPNPFQVPQYAVTTAALHQVSGAPARTALNDVMLVTENFEYHLKAGDTISVEKFATVVTSRDIAINDQSAAARHILEAAADKSFEQHLTEQTAAWKTRWDRSDVEIKGDPEAQQGIRFNIFQLFSTYYGEDDRLNVGPKGFTGEKYGGATYWDTEAYIIPMYLSVAEPEVTEKLLKYRYHQLAGAFLNAERQGLKGALYPMVTFTGVECHNEWEITFEEIHRNGAIAYAIYNYTNYTGDDRYLKSDGIKVLTSIARFWADRVHFSKRKNQYMIHGVTGPNEYENNINNNWYTNYLAAWVLRYTLAHYDQADEESKQELLVSDEEKALWQDIIDKMYYPEDKELGIFVQHDTFLDKDLMTTDQLAPEDRPLNQNWSWDKILRSCFIKQADVLQGMYLFGDEFTQEEKERNFDFYEPMTVHESSLSPSVHAIIAAELGKEAKAVELYGRTARLDLDNYNNDTDDGLHITSMSGSWLAIVHGFARMRTFGGQLGFAPFCPESWTGYSFKINYRGRLINISVAQKQAAFELISGEPLTIELYGESKELADQIVIDFD